MAFQQPQQRPLVQRQLSFSTQQDAPPPAAGARKRHLEESQEWILFSPVHDTTTTLSQTSQTPRTATDLGSLETHFRSQPADSSAANETAYQASELDDDNAELDSLDDGLHAFHHHPFSASSNPLDQSGGTVLPTHDGLGTFPSSAGLQEQLWQFERYNPHRKRHIRRRSSVQKKLEEVLEGDEDIDEADERTARIEKWRLDQSRAVLEEIEREAKRRQRRASRRSGASGETRPGMRESLLSQGVQSMESVMAEEPATISTHAAPSEQPTESWWQRLTRRVIQNLIGLDDNTLSVILGEQLVEDVTPTPTPLSPLAAAAEYESRVAFHDNTLGWETKLLERIARELGVLVHHFAEHEHEHDGAFHTYAHPTEQMEYAGLPMAPPARLNRSPLRSRKRRASEHEARPRAPSDALFSPTLPQTPAEQADTSLWGIEEEPAQPPTQEEEFQRQERAYWERDLDLPTLVSYLRRHFAFPARPPPETATGPLPSSWTTSALGTSPESLRRAEVIRSQHPLVSRAAERVARTRRDSLLRRHQLQHLMQRHRAAGSSSCASQSTKRTRRSLSGSSRHYWLDGSVGSIGSGPAMSSGLGGWGEV